MNFKLKKITALLLVALYSSTGIPATTDLSNAPLTNAGSTTVRPNIMMIFDTSGSMGWDYTPDYINDAYTCYDGDDRDNNGNIIANTAPDYCDRGDPPYMSPDFNAQYYNSTFRYKPPLNALGAERQSMTAAFTSNWTQVPSDSFGILSTSKHNIATNYPERIWCKDQNGADDSLTTRTNCTVNENDYVYPEVLDSKGIGVPVYHYGRDTTGKIRYRYSYPYYFNIVPTEYCTSADYKNCKSLTSPGTGADAAYVYPAKIRFCTDSTLTNCQAKFKDTGTTTFKRPKYVGVYNPSVFTAAATAKATLTVSSVEGNATGIDITEFKINGVDITGPISTASTSTNTIAEDLRTKINAQSGAHGFSATRSNNVLTISSVDTNGASWNGKEIKITSEREINTLPVYTWTFTKVSKTSTMTVNKVGTVINSTNVLTGDVSKTKYTNDDLASRQNFCGLVKAKVDTNSFDVTKNCTASGSNAVLEFSPKASLISDVLPWNNTGSISSTNVSITRSKTDGTMKAVKFQINGTPATPGISASGTTSGGSDLNLTALAARTGVGQWQKTVITPSNNSYPKSTQRDDCAGATCTYAEEMENFANWYSYYRTRNQSMKTAVGKAFSILNDNYRVGLMGLQTRPGDMSSVDADFHPVAPFTPNSTHRASWYTKLYNINASSGTPLREALYSAGIYYEGGSSAVADPIEYSCQQNYAFLATDGYWNGDYSSWNLILNNEDSTDSGYSKRSDGAYDGGRLNQDAVGGSLADVAMHFYKKDMRPGTGTKGLNNVPTTAKDKNTGQHMVTYTMGLGVDGLMTYQKDYETATLGDFNKIRNGSTDCSWETNSTDVCNWPASRHDSQAAVDDLWHAAVNGRGKYYSAKNPQDAADGLNDALTQIQQTTGAAAASATSSPNITPTDNSIFSSTYQTVLWDGEVIKQRIDPSSGNILPFDSGQDWKASTSVSTQADQLANGTANARNLYTFDLSATSTDKKKSFEYSSLTAAEKAYFANKCSGIGGFSQCNSTMTASKKSTADLSQNLIDFIRGYNKGDAFDDNGIPYGYLNIYRAKRTNRLGDTVNATPVYVRLPQYTFNYETGGELYGDFKTLQAHRDGVLYIAANDGFLHAFNGSTGAELWAYSPRIIMPNLYKLGDVSYEQNHQYYVDGSPTTMDVFDSNTQTWKTILVGGLNKGGQGFYALDITSPTSPKALWEVCSDTTNCKSAFRIEDLGYSYGNPVITRLPAGNVHAGKWVVLISSGYNNVTASGSTGVGKMFVLDAITGTLLDTYSTGEGTLTTPSGLSKISTIASNFYYDGYSTVAYAGDLNGHVWRFDLAKSGSASDAVKLLGVAKDSDGNTQPITTRIEVGAVPNTTDKPILFIATGKYLGVDDISSTQQNSIYAIKDPFYTGGSGMPELNLRDALVANTIVTDPDTGVRTVDEATQPVDWATDKGWYVDLPDTGERVNLDPQLNLGTLLVAANVVNPSISNACSVGGYSYLYQFNYKTGSYLENATNAAVAKRNNNALLVGNVVVRLPSGVMKVITTSATGAKTVDALFVSGSTASGTRISWRELPM